MPSDPSSRSGAPLGLLVVQRRLVHYRVPFFERLRTRLAACDIELKLVVGDATPEEAARGDAGRLPWAVHRPCRYLAGDRLCWQSIGDLVATSDLVIVTQENRLLNNLPLLWRSRHARVGLWGHGRNFQARHTAGSSFATRWKETTSRRADWWFAYTELSAEVVRGFYYPADRITVLNNAVDTTSLRKDIDLARAEAPRVLRRRHGLPELGPLGLYLGSLHADKRLEQLVAVADRVREQSPGFELMVVGAGPMQPMLTHCAASRPWLHLLGARMGAEKAELLACADVLLNPGMVGLGILDGLVGGVPMVTTDCGIHSPEIAYLKHGENGLVVPDSVPDMAAAVLSLLNRPDVIDTLRAGCARDAERYTLDAMVSRFCEGVCRWRQSPRLEQHGGSR